MNTTVAEQDRTIDFWFDPSCPFCWTTARWIVDEVLPYRNVEIAWQPISLLFKNDPPDGTDYYRRAMKSHRMLRLVEAVRAAAESDEAGNRDVFALYWELGSRIHHDRDIDFDLADALTSVGLDPALASAAEDESWDDVIRKKMDDGLDLVGEDVGTPIVATHNEDGECVGYFGPVITKIPTGADSLKLWDAVMDMMDVEGFYELKKTRDERPDPGPHPRATGGSDTRNR